METCKSCSSQAKPVTGCASERCTAVRAPRSARDIAVLGVTAAVVISSALGGTFGDAIPGIALLFAAGTGMIASGALRLPRWARLRERQMGSARGSYNILGQGHLSRP